MFGKEKNIKHRGVCYFKTCKPDIKYNLDGIDSPMREHVLFESKEAPLQSL